MRILLVGEYSRLHNSLKEGLIALGHEVVLTGNGDGFKNYPADYSTKAKWSKSLLPNILRQIVFRIFKYDFAEIEQGIRFYFLLQKFRDFDVVQLINECPIKTVKKFELYLLKKLVKQNRKTFLLCSGVDYLGVKFMTENKNHKSIMTPLWNDTSLRDQYGYVLEYLSAGHKKIHEFLYNTCHGVIATDLDYVFQLEGNPKFLGLIPNPVNCANFFYETTDTSGKISIFLGINQGNYNQKGIPYFEKALDIIRERFSGKVEIIVTRDMAYKDYIKSYAKAHILLDQTYAFDQGYNALEAMARGKVVFTGAGKEFETLYNLENAVNIDAKPDVDYLVKELSRLIENPELLNNIGLRARLFIEKEHDHIKIAERYIEAWKRQL